MKNIAIIFVILLTLASPTQSQPRIPEIKRAPILVKASWYGKRFHKHRTANGEIFNQFALTAAHNTLPANTLVKVTNLDNGKEVTVRINDTGSFGKYGRGIDLSYGAAKEIDMVKVGVQVVKLEVIKYGEKRT